MLSFKQTISSLIISIHTGTDAFPKQTGNHCAFLNSFCDTLMPSEDYIKTSVVRQIYLEYVKIQMQSTDSKILDHAKKGFFRQFKIEACKRNFRDRTKPRGYYISINRTIRSRIDKDTSHVPSNPKELCEKIFIDNKIGHGVFAKVNIQQETRVLEYEGQWVSKKIHNEREVMYTKNELPPVDVHDQRRGLVLDGNRNKFGNLFSNDENIARFLNHSRKNPNCKLKMENNLTILVGYFSKYEDTVDITFLIDDEFEPTTSECHIASFIEDIPSGGIGYKLHTDKIMADVMKNCSCDRKCADIISNDFNILKPVQDMRAKYYMTKTGNERTTKLLDLIRTSMCAELDGSLRLHNFMGQLDTCNTDYEKLDLTLGNAAIKKMKDYLTYEENEWWQNFFRNQESVQSNEATWPLSNIDKLHRLEDIQIRNFMFKINVRCRRKS
ncbi:unnamed protein product [Mytilus coruscus]|uniref:SET domain-containing protein n=1 Tax=Mytilus coruscus TaxID=42192 RepID=A0A6J8EV52_MYTCO|nr:unnamed protein product [Mytilus coruscus]